MTRRQQQRIATGALSLLSCACLAGWLFLMYEPEPERQQVGLGMYVHHEGEFTVYTYDDWPFACRWKEGMKEPICKPNE